MQAGEYEQVAAQGSTNAGEKPVEQVPLDISSPPRWRPCMIRRLTTEKDRGSFER